MTDDPANTQWQSTQPQPSPPHGRDPEIESTPEERTTGLLLHLSQLLGLTLPILAIIAPLIIWQVKREQSKYLDWHGKEAVNFQITAFIAWCVTAVIAFMTCGLGAFLFLPLVVAEVVCVILATVRANEGKCWRYPLTIRLVT